MPVMSGSPPVCRATTIVNPETAAIAQPTASDRVRFLIRPTADSTGATRRLLSAPPIPINSATVAATPTPPSIQTPTELINPPLTVWPHQAVVPLPNPVISPTTSASANLAADSRFDAPPDRTISPRVTPAEAPRRRPMLAAAPAPKASPLTTASTGDPRAPLSPPKSHAPGRHVSRIAMTSESRATPAAT